MLEFDEDISKTWESYVYPSGEFYKARAVRHYIDADFNLEIFDLLESKIKEQYKNRKNVRIQMDSFKTKEKTIGIWVTTTFTEKADYFGVVKEVLEEFEQSYEKLKKETEGEDTKIPVASMPSVIGRRYGRK